MQPWDQPVRLIFQLLMDRFIRSPRVRLLFAALFVLSIITSACSGGTTAPPSQPGEYSVQKDSVHFDGDRYTLYWADNNGSLHQLKKQKMRLVRDPHRPFTA